AATGLGAAHRAAPPPPVRPEAERPPGGPRVPGPAGRVGGATGAAAPGPGEQSLGAHAPRGAARPGAGGLGPAGRPRSGSVGPASPGTPQHQRDGRGPGHHAGGRQDAPAARPGALAGPAGRGVWGGDAMNASAKPASGSETADAVLVEIVEEV